MTDPSNRGSVRTSSGLRWWCHAASGTISDGRSLGYLRLNDNWIAVGARLVLAVRRAATRWWS